MIGTFLREHPAFDIFSLTSIGLLIASFIVPPTGIIDGSVLAGAAEIFAWGALYVVLKAVDKGTPASISHGGTTVTVNKDELQEVELE